MSVKIEKLADNLVKLDIEVEAELAAQEYNKSCRRICGRINIPGFRKGKAPRQIIENHVGVQKIQAEALDRILPGVFAEIITENNFEVITQPTIESYEYEIGKQLKVVARLELKPEVKLGKYTKLEVEADEFKLGEDAFEKELDAIKSRFATLEPVIGRAVKNTDIVVIDFNGTVDEVPIKGGSAKNYQLDIANSNFIPGFAEQIIGKSISEDFTIDVTFPTEYHDKDLAGKPAKFEIKINEIKEKNIPELNDELAQKVGSFQTADELKEDIKKYLEKSVESENKRRAEKAVFAKIIDIAEVEIPDSMVNREAKNLMNEVQGNMKQQGVSWEQVLDSQGHENIGNNLRDEAIKRIKNSLVLEAISKKENLVVSDEEFEQKVKELAAMYGTDENTVYKQFQSNPSLAQQLAAQILGQKISDFIVKNNTVKYVESK